MLRCGSGGCRFVTSPMAPLPRAAYGCRYDAAAGAAIYGEQHFAAADAIDAADAAAYAAAAAIAAFDAATIRCCRAMPRQLRAMLLMRATRR